MMRYSNFPPAQPLRRDEWADVVSSPVSIEATQVADAARQILENEAFQSIYDTMKGEILEELWRTPPSAQVLLVELAAQAGALQAVQQRLQAYIDNAKLERVKRAKQDTSSG